MSPDAVLEVTLLLSFFVTIAQAGETNTLTAKLGATLRSPLPTLQGLAAKHERAGRKREAAALYETMARTNTAARKVLSHRLVTIYLDTGETNKALTWARLGQWKEARRILEHEIARNANATRAVTLRCQLAEVCESLGDKTRAETLLNDAANVASGTAMEPLVRLRSNALNQRAK